MSSQNVKLIPGAKIVSSNGAAGSITDMTVFSALTDEQKHNETIHQYRVLRHFHLPLPYTAHLPIYQKNHVVTWALNDVNETSEQYIIDRANVVLFNNLRYRVWKRYFTTMCVLRECILQDINLKGFIPTYANQLFGEAMVTYGHYASETLMRHICDLYHLSRNVFGDGSSHYKKSRYEVLGDKPSYQDREAWRKYIVAFKELTAWCRTRQICEPYIDRNCLYWTLRTHPHHILNILTFPIRSVYELDQRTRDINAILNSLREV